jgi:hypothetical protein
MPTKIATAPPSNAAPHRWRGLILSLEEGFIAGAEYYVLVPLYPMVDRNSGGFCILRAWRSAATRGTQSGLPRVPDVRAPSLFLIFSGLPAAILWLIFWGIYPALVALVLPLPLSFLLAGFYHLGVLGGRYGYTVTWRVLAYPLGFFLPFTVVPVLGLLGAAYFGLVLMPVGLTKVQEVGAWKAVLVCVTVGVLFGVAYYFLSVA